MSSGNRTVKYENLLKSLRKHYRPLADPPERSVLEHLLYGCCLEDARIDQADEGFAKLQQTYFDWNEVRVTTVAELAEALKPLPFPSQAASRIKQCLQSIFETRYQYDIDDMKKANLGKATAELKAWKGMSPFVVSYVSQHALGGHSIPASNLICDAMWQCDILTLAELQKKSLPGVERAIPKNKGVEFAGLLLQFASDLYHHPRGSAPLAVLKEMGATYKTKPKPEAQASDSKAKGSKTSAAKLAPEKTSGTPEPEVKKSEPAASASKVAPEQPAAKGSAAKAPATKAPAGKETPTSNKVAVSKDTKSPNKATSKVDSKVGAKPTSSKADASKNDKNAKPKAEASKPAKPAQVKGKPEKGKQDKGKPSYSKAQSSKLEKGKPEKSKPEKGKTQKAKPEKSPLEKPKSDKNKPIKKESKDSGKSTKAPVKGNHSSVGTSLTKKKPR